MMLKLKQFSGRVWGGRWLAGFYFFFLSPQKAISNVKLLLFAVDAEGSGALSCAMGMTFLAVGWLLRNQRGICG